MIRIKMTLERLSAFVGAAFCFVFLDDLGVLDLFWWFHAIPYMEKSDPFKQGKIIRYE